MNALPVGVSKVPVKKKLSLLRDQPGHGTVSTLSKTETGRSMRPMMTVKKYTKEAPVKMIECE